MKKKIFNVDKLKLNKQIITNLNSARIFGGVYVDTVKPPVCNSNLAHSCMTAATLTSINTDDGHTCSQNTACV